jgi:Flp pilus assembly protein TadG
MRTDERGGVAILFALALIPLVGFTGAALDYSRATRVRTILQAALDGAVMETARTSSGLPQTTQQQAIKSYVESRLGKADLSNLAVEITAGNGSLQASASGGVPTTITSLLGFKSMPITASAEATWGIQKIEIALVLDNTGSMSEVLGSQTKIQSLITASNNFIDSMKNISGSQGNMQIGLFRLTHR